MEGLHTLLPVPIIAPSRFHWLGNWEGFQVFLSLGLSRQKCCSQEAELYYPNSSSLQALCKQQVFPTIASLLQRAFLESLSFTPLFSTSCVQVGSLFPPAPISFFKMFLKYLLVLQLFQTTFLSIQTYQSQNFQLLNRCRYAYASMGRTSPCECILAVPPGAVLQKKPFRSTDSRAASLQTPCFFMLRVSEISHTPFNSKPTGLSQRVKECWHRTQHFQCQCLPIQGPAGRSGRLNHWSVSEGAAGDGNRGVGSRRTRDNSSAAGERRLITSLHKFQSITPCCSRPLMQGKHAVQWQGYTVCIQKWFMEMISNDFGTNFCLSPSGVH